MQWSRSVGVAVIEDVCQAPAATRAGQLLGTFGDLAVMSFGGSKLLTAGRGGAVLCNDEAMAQRINVFKERGNDAFALSELQACVLLPQFETLAERHALRRDNVNTILETTAPCTGITPLNIKAEDSPAFYKLAWVLHDSQRRQDLLCYAQEKGIPLFAGFNGFVKRSERRCRKPVPLVHSTAAAEATVLLHHPVLLQGSNVIRELAEELADVFNR
jgi:dTDP-4-amino-4,6-dideoxygalactose transaminase